MKVFNKHQIVAFLVSILIGILAIACTPDDDYISEHQGVWSGRYTGSGDEGKWELTVDAKGNITGILTSEVIVQTFQLEGKVKKDGRLDVVIGSVSSGASFSGQMNGDSASGTWVIESENLSGEWSGTRTKSVSASLLLE